MSASLRDRAGRASHRAPKGSRPYGDHPSRGASRRFLSLTRNIDLAQQALEEPWRVERTPKAAGDVVI